MAAIGVSWRWIYERDGGVIWCGMCAAMGLRVMKMMKVLAEW